MTLVSLPTHFENFATWCLRSVFAARFLVVSVGLFVCGAGSSAAQPLSAIAMHGTPKYSGSFPHFDYVNPDAPKGGRLTLGEHGSFDSLNPLIIKGVSAAGVRDFVYESLLARGRDEPFTLYSQIAQFVEMPDDRRSITFHINKDAHFSDGESVDADDVIFSWEVLRDRGRPNHRTYYSKVARVERHDAHKVTFHFDESGDRELPLILGLMPVLPSHILDRDSFEKTTLKPVVGSGPYIIKTVDPGRSILYARDPNWWGRDLPTNRGRFNFDEIRFDYFRDSSAMFEAFKTGSIDLRVERDPARWAESYAIDAVRDGKIVKQEFDIGLPAGMTGLVFNTRRSVFSDIRVRAALIRVFDFEWVNKNLFHGRYKRTASYFERSLLSSALRKADQRELGFLSPFDGVVAPDILAGTYTLPRSDGSGQNRVNWRNAVKMLGEAGYKLVGGKMIHQPSGAPLTFEMLASNPSQERVFLSFARDLRRIGVIARVRVVDSAQYQSRLKDYDFDMIQYRWGSSLSPGNEQLFRWSAELADRPGTFNFAGVKEPAVDAMIGEMLKARTSEAFVSAVRALDRVLLSGNYVVPMYHLPKQWVAHWSHLQGPERTPVFGYQLDTWWVRP